MTDLIAIQKIAGWEKLKTLVLDSVSSPITKRVYNMALDEFLGWFQSGREQKFCGMFGLTAPFKYGVALSTELLS